MASLIDAFGIYRRLGKVDWRPPIEWGDGFLFQNREKGQMIVTPLTGFDTGDDALWIHASISRVDYMPDYADMKLMHQAVFDQGFSYQVFVPEEEHVNFHEHALHLWGRKDGKSAIPNFGEMFYKTFGVRMV